MENEMASTEVENKTRTDIMKIENSAVIGQVNMSILNKMFKIMTDISKDSDVQVKRSEKGCFDVANESYNVHVSVHLLGGDGILSFMENAFLHSLVEISILSIKSGISIDYSLDSQSHKHTFTFKETSSTFKEKKQETSISSQDAVEVLELRLSVFNELGLGYFTSSVVDLCEHAENILEEERKAKSNAKEEAAAEKQKELTSELDDF